MKAEWTIKEKSTGELLVTVDGAEWEKAKDKSFGKLAKSVTVDGFRKGQVPNNIAKKHISEQQILLEAVNDAAQDAFAFGLEDQKVDPIVQPTLDVQSLTADACIYKFVVVVKPEVVLGEYKGVKADPISVEVSDEDVDAQVEKYREDMAELVVKETGKVRKGDTVVLDFEGFKEGVAFDGGKGENYSLEIGSNSFIPGFEDGLKGMETGEEKDLELTFPESYQVEDLAGQKVVFKVKVNEIKKKQLPKLNDAFVKDVNLDGVETVDQLKEKIRSNLTEERTTDAENKANDELLSRVVDNANVEIPNELIDDEKNQMFNELQQRLMQQGLNFDTYKQILGTTEEAVKDQMGEEAERRVKVRLVLEAIADKEDLKSTEEEVEQEYSEIATQYGLEVDKVKELASPSAIAYDLRIRKAFDLVKATKD